MINYKKYEIKSSYDNILRTRTYEDWRKMLGEKAHKMGLMAKLYPNNTISALTDLLGNVWMGDLKKKLSGFTAVDSTYVEWEVNP